MSAGMVDNYQAGPFQHPHRKPLPPGIQPPNPRRFEHQYQQQQPQQQQQQHNPQQQQHQHQQQQYQLQQHQHQQQQHQQQQPQYQPQQPQQYSATQTQTHQAQSQMQPANTYQPRARPASSSYAPQAAPPSSYGQIPLNTNPVSYQAHMNQQHNPPARRTLSNATASTTSTGGPVRANSSGSSHLQRTTSSRSGNSPTSYVALMRKQKATVWCDRAQQEDPRLLAQQRAAKMRAAMEVSNANAAGRASTSGTSLSGGVRSKIRHHGMPKAQQYTPTTHPAHGVPVRLSANEVDEEESDEDGSHKGAYHHRSGSGRSSLGSGTGRIGSMYMTQAVPGVSAGSTPSSARAHSPSKRISPEDTPLPEVRGPDYFVPTAKGTFSKSVETPGAVEAEREMSFGGIGGLPQRLKPPMDEAAKKLDLADLRRRGSVDERTTTMSGYGRLFVANPDVD